MWKPTNMRRSDRLTPDHEAKMMLEQGEWGVLASSDGDGVPLCTPLSYVVMDNGIYFHCAGTGQKLDNIAAQPRVCFCVVGSATPAYRQNNFTTLYQSVVVHGKATAVADAAEKTRALMAICEKYLPAHMDKAPPSIAGALAATCVVRIEIEHMTGKANGE